MRTKQVSHSISTISRSTSLEQDECISPTDCNSSNSQLTQNDSEKLLSHPPKVSPLLCRPHQSAPAADHAKSRIADLANSPRNTILLAPNPLLNKQHTKLHCTALHRAYKSTNTYTRHTHVHTYIHTYSIELRIHITIHTHISYTNAHTRHAPLSNIPQHISIPFQTQMQTQKSGHPPIHPPTQYIQYINTPIHVPK